MYPFFSNYYHFDVVVKSPKAWLKSPNTIDASALYIGTLLYLYALVEAYQGVVTVAVS